MEQWLKNYLDSEGKLTAYPSKRKLKIATMFYIASKLQENEVSDKRYTEKEINEAIDSICRFHDAALLRREMYNYRFINRTNDGKEYWLEEIQPDPEKYDLLGK